MGAYCAIRGIIVPISISPNSYANQISMSRSLFKGSFLLVEGNTDEKLFNKFTHEYDCRVKGIEGKDIAIEVLKALEKRKINGVLLIVDADFDHLEKKKPFSNNMFYTDTHDIETMIMLTRAFEHFLSEFTDKKKLDSYLKKKSKNLREVLTEACISIGYVRWVSIRKRWALKFRNLDFAKFVNIKKIELNFIQFISELIKNSPGNKVPQSIIVKEAKKLNSISQNPWMICCGHDLTSILLLGLKHIFGYNTGKLTRIKLEAMLRLSYEFRFFQNTKIYQNLRSWEKKNSPYIIFT